MRPHEGADPLERAPSLQTSCREQDPHLARRHRSRELGRRCEQQLLVRVLKQRREPQPGLHTSLLVKVTPDPAAASVCALGVT